MTAGLEIYNFGTGVPSRVLDIVSLIREEFPEGKDPVVQYGAKDEISKQYNSYDRASQVLGWQPKVKLKEGIYKTVQWWKDERYG
jgi:UDP-glucose 4-epimerase